MTRLLTRDEVAYDIQLLQSGYRFCGCCGRVKLSPLAPKWMDICGECYPKHLARKYCRDCGSELEARRVEHARDHGGVCKRCLYCTKKMDATFCAGCNVRHPWQWHSSGVPLSI